MHKIIFAFFFILLSNIAFAQYEPTFEDVISLKNVNSVVISPNGQHTAITVQSADWVDNSFDTEIWLSKNNQSPFQLTNNPKGTSNSPQFSPDGQWLAFLSNRGNKTQIHVIRVEGGEANAVTKEEENINSFKWHPSGKKLVFVKSEPDTEKKNIQKRYGSFETDEKDFTFSHLWEIEFKPELPDPSEFPCYETVDSLKVKAGCIVFPKSTRLTEGKFTVTNFHISPDGFKIAYSHQPNPIINSFLKSDISILDLKDKKSTLIVSNLSTDKIEAWSPDSKEILYTTSLDDTLSNFYKNSKVFALDINSGKSRQLAAELDDNLTGFIWTNNGIFTTAWNKTKRHVYLIDPKSGKHSVWLQQPEQIYYISFSNNGDHFALVARNADQLNEVFVATSTKRQLTKVTDYTAQIRNWYVAQSEVIQWPSKDGEIIEGVLHKPHNYDPKKKYPLLVLIHGGPTAIDVPSPVPSRYYPVNQWLNKGALVLRVNYRGSTGYGERFRSLNVRNLGVGDAWDVLSGVEYLDQKSLIDKDRMGCMGWSQGGYISAFLTTNSDVFKAISVGAGISDWKTYYVSTDIHLFTRQYLKATPWSDEAIYKLTSPMTNINNAKTPTLIQHGEFDQRVPISNAYELIQGLRDKGVPSELIVYNGFGHGLTKPKELLACNWHNWQWFNKYIWNETVEIPTK